MSTELSPEDQERIAKRYPGRSRLDVALWCAGVLALIGAVALVAWSGLIRSNPDVVAMVRSFDVQSAELTVAEIVVQRSDPQQAAECTVFAQAVSYERVAELTVEVPPSDEELYDLYVDVATIKEATSVSVEGCRIV